MTQPADKLVLVVDDEPNVREYLQAILEDAGFRVLTAGDGEEALKLIKSKKPDFISLDLVMPRKSGHRLLYELRRSKELSRIPVLIVTAHAKDDLGGKDMKDLLDNRIMSGPGTYLEKPVNPRTYVDAIRRALNLPVSEENHDRVDLAEQIRKGLTGASPDALRQALQALQKKGG
ncbi:MAG: response regulator [Deltaproteobacteria bacterium]|nr:response regulator [Deltaproteobacteria bacterium]